MKRLAVIISLLATLLVMVATSAMADTVITSGEWVKLVSYNTTDNAGIMTYAVSKSNGGSIIGYYDTFCIQDNVYVWQNIWYPVADVSNIVGEFDSPPKAGSGMLAGVIDYLFYRYKIGAYDSWLTSPANQADFQEFLWGIQGTGSIHTPIADAPWTADANAYNDPQNGLQHPWGTEVINIASGIDSAGKFIGPDIQNQLYNAVPEPSTLLLLGFGLTALGLAARRK